MTNRIVGKAEDAPEEMLEALASARVPDEYAYLDALLEPDQRVQALECGEPLECMEPFDHVEDGAGCQVRRHKD